MGKAKGRTRQQRGLVEMNPASEASAWVPPPPEECEEHEYDIRSVDVGWEIHVRFVTHRGAPIEFAFTQRVRGPDNDWKDVIRVDTCHDEVHVHRFGRTGNQISRTVLWPVSDADDIARGMNEAERLVVDAAEENVRRWRHGR